MGKALIYEQILLTNSSRKCMEISLENLHLDIGALELKGLKTEFQDGTQGVFPVFKEDVDSKRT